jgi:cytoskeletal protein RodZ
VNRATWALLAASLLFGAAILAFVLTSGGSTRVVRTQTTVVEAPPLTPLPRDSGPKNNLTRSSTASQSSQSTVQPQNGSLPVKTRPEPKTTHKPSSGAHQPSTPAQPSNPPPSQPPPVVGVTVPLPATVCLRPAATVNC